MFLADGTWDALGEAKPYARSLAYGLPIFGINLMKNCTMKSVEPGYITKYTRTRKRPLKRASMNPRVCIRKPSRKLDSDDE